MAYEYEDEIKEYLRYATRPDTEKYLEMHLELTKVYKKAYLLREMTKTMLIPIEEIYAKAKAFDEIRRIENLCYYVEYDKYSGIDREAFKTHTFTKNTLKTIRNWEDK